MPFAEITAAIGSLNTARELAKAMLAARDQALIQEKVRAMNEELLKAQDSLFAHNAALAQLQREQLESAEQLRILKEALRERSRYSLFQISPDHFVYRVNVPPELGGASEPGSAEPMHYICQSCCDNGRKVVLQGRTVSRLTTGRGIRTRSVRVWHCPLCRNDVPG